MAAEEAHMMPINRNWIRVARAGGAVKRLHTRSTLRNYTNAEHTYGTLVLVGELCRVNPDTRVHDCSMYMLGHDIAEGYTGDIPANVKLDNPQLNKELDAIEQRWTTANMPLLHNILSDLERKICKCADLLDLGLFCAEEYAMGNRTLVDVYGRVVQYLQQPSLRDVAGVDDIINLMQGMKNG